MAAAPSQSWWPRSLRSWGSEPSEQRFACSEGPGELLSSSSHCALLESLSRLCWRLEPGGCYGCTGRGESQELP